MTDEQIDKLAEIVGDQLRVAVCELRDNIKAAELAIYEETQDNDEAKPKLALSFGINVNLLNRNIETKLSVSTKHTLKSNGQLPDPSQPEFPITAEGADGDGILAIGNGTAETDDSKALARR